MKIGILKTVLDSEVKNPQIKSLDEVIGDLKQSGVEVVIFEPKDKNFTASLTDGRIYETEDALRGFYSSVKTGEIKVKIRKYSKTIAFLLSIFPATGVLGIHAFYAKKKLKTRAFHIVLDIVLLVLFILFNVSATIYGSAQILLYGDILVSIMYVISLIEGFYLLFKKD